ncbi:MULTISPECIES: mycofactocin system GMC family oxidoreductase MftG [unclassified Gordonia (in: high G+C Gram-positive bacteria)]|uniref:mycofactocin system GMC family oxidoreductase MftG n=1 Tax=unclassified Gordonia (in: high G+C Gram-positive bacteria) TaxID=2657482 RepID=UPI001E471FE4|nr:MULTISPECIES: mycofactocin system GMC family oxidoreductase MftG [unclassified Gordonia (in: high G+C Gram-positive bacteria)]
MPTSTANRDSVDVVIVGAGSSGCVLAERLSRHEKRSVLVLEQGPSEWPDASVLDLRRLPISDGERYVTQHRESSGLPVVRGRGLGGSSAVNGAYCMRFHRDDFDAWQGPWTPDVIDKAYAEVDEKMGVHPFPDADLAPTALAFERYWGETYSTRQLDDPWPLVGVNRVRSNSVDGIRRTAADAYLRPHLNRPNLRVRTGVKVDRVLLADAKAVGVVCDGRDIRAREVILCAGTLGSAAVLLRSGVAGEHMRVHEHREVLVGYRLREQPEPGPLLQTVVHTGDGLEIRCYRDDFARYVGGLTPSGPAVGVAAMAPGAPGEVYLDGVDAGVRLDRPDDRVLRDMARTAHEVVEMLRSSEFGGLVVADSIAIDPVLRTSQHAWGSMPMGGRTDWLGAVRGVGHLRVVDGSILPAAGRSGPHATTMMVAAVIGDVVAAD